MKVSLIVITYFLFYSSQAFTTVNTVYPETYIAEENAKDDCYSKELHELGSYQEAINAIESEKSFQQKDRIKTPGSSWITGAAWYSCDNKSGYFILQAGRRNYLHEGVPLSIWNAFKSAGSFGQFYDSNIKGHYRF